MKIIKIDKIEIKAYPEKGKISVGLMIKKGRLTRIENAKGENILAKLGENNECIKLYNFYWSASGGGRVGSPYYTLRGYIDNMEYLDEEKFLKEII